MLVQSLPASIQPFCNRLCSVITISITSIQLLACAHQPSVTNNAHHLSQTPSHVEEKETTIELKEAARRFEADTLYDLLVAELAGSRNRFDVMLDNYVKQAVKTQDLGVTERAAQLATYTQNSEATLNMTSQWAALEPENKQARYLAMASLADSGRYFEAFEHGAYLIQQNYQPHGLNALAVKILTTPADAQTAEDLLKRYTALALQYKGDAELALGQSFLHFHLQAFEPALRYAKIAQKLAPEQEQGYLQELRILEKKSPEVLEARLAKIVKQFPENQRLRLRYARQLTRSDVPKAIEQFKIMLEQDPNDFNVQLAIALLYFEQKQFDLAKEHLSVLTYQPQQASAAHYYLGQITQQQGDELTAITHYSAVTPGKEFLPAMVRATRLLHQYQRHEEALALLTTHQLTADELYQEGLIVLLSDHYKALKQYSETQRVLNKGLEQFPRSEILLYSRAMEYLAENQIHNAIDDFEALLTLNPSHANALNSLGYVLADNNIRLHDAKAYIEAALELDPNSAATLDSLGWVYYRMGQYPEAITYLTQAFEQSQNDEIAAHLGEALWVAGYTAQAVEVWKKGLEINPRSRDIHERLKRFKLAPAPPQKTFLPNNNSAPVLCFYIQYQPTKRHQPQKPFL